MGSRGTNGDGRSLDKEAKKASLPKTSVHVIAALGARGRRISYRPSPGPSLMVYIVTIGRGVRIISVYD